MRSIMPFTSTNRVMIQITNLRVLKSIRASCSISGRWILTATVSPVEARTALWTWPSDAAAVHLCSTMLNTSSTGLPNSDSMTDTTWSKGAGGTSSCIELSKAMAFSGSRSMRELRNCPKHTCYEALRGLLEFLAFGMYTSSIPFLVLTIYHVLTYLIISIMDTYNNT